MPHPRHFCWTKFSAEAGEEACSIVRRKEDERLTSGGVFLWGIGNSIRPSLLALLERTAEPTVVFTPMLSPAAPHDRNPQSVGVWIEAMGMDGRPFEMPAGSIVTSGFQNGAAPKRHYALVCQRDAPLTDAEDSWLDEEHLRNLRTGSRVGASQVTSVVELIGDLEPRPRYTVAFSARLVAPFHVVLTEWVPASAKG